MKLLKYLYTWIVLGFAAGVSLGFLCPSMAEKTEFFGTEFVKLIRAFIGPIVFLTVSLGIARTSSLGKLGRVGLKSTIYFESISTFALLIGWCVALVVQPGANMHIEVSELNTRDLGPLLQGSKNLTFSNFIESIIPKSVVAPFVSGDMLQVLVLGVLFGISLLLVRSEHARNLTDTLSGLLESLFQTIKLVMYVSPLGVFGAMAFAIAHFGENALFHMLLLMATFYVSGILFIVFILGGVALAAGFSIFQFLRYIFPEIILVIATSSSEVALPHLLSKLRRLGLKQETIGIVVPIGYSFNLDGTNIYITLAALFIAQALGIHLTFLEQLVLFITAMISSKGAAGVAGAGFITLAATIAIVPSIPVAGIVLVLGVDRFMSDARAIINYIGNGVAALVVGIWEGELTRQEISQRLKEAIESGAEV